MCVYFLQEIVSLFVGTDFNLIILLLFCIVMQIDHPSVILIFIIWFAT